MLNDLKRRGELPSFAKITLNGKTIRLMEENRGKSRRNSKGAHRRLVKGRFHRPVYQRHQALHRDGHRTRKPSSLCLRLQIPFSDAAADFMKNLSPSLRFLSPHSDRQRQRVRQSFRPFSGKVRYRSFSHLPPMPPMNSEIERFNGTLSDAFIKQNRMLLAYDIEAFNQSSLTGFFGTTPEGLTGRLA